MTTYNHQPGTQVPAMKIISECSYEQLREGSPSTLCIHREGDYTFLPIQWEEKYIDDIMESWTPECQPWDLRAPKGWPEPMKMEFHVFTENLRVWSGTRTGPTHMSAREIFIRCFLEGPEFTETHGKLWKDSVKTALHDPLEEPYDPEDNSEVVPITDIEDVFPPQCLFYWKLPESDDYQFCLEPPPSVEAAKLQEFKQEFKNLLKEYGPKTIRHPTPIDWMKYITESKCFYKGIKMPVWKARSKAAKAGEHPFTCAEPKNFEFHALPVQKNSFETRSAVACELNTLNSIQYLNHIGKQVFEFFPGNMMASKDLKSDFEKIRTQGCKYALIDIEKCGLTFPPSLLQAASEALKEEYPDFRWDFLTGFKGAKLIWNERTWEVQRGYCLGMANEFATAILITLFTMFKKEHDEVRGWFFNDDSFLEYPEDTHVPIGKEWITLCESYGIPIKRSKCATGKGVVFCEMYKDVTFAAVKVVQSCNTIHKVLHAINIAHAKALMNASIANIGATTTLNHHHIAAMNRVIQCWGYEFPVEYKERSKSFRLGGWVTDRSFYLDTSLRILWDLTGEEYKKASYLLTLSDKNMYTWENRDLELMKSLSKHPVWRQLRNARIPEECNPIKNLDMLLKMPKSVGYYKVLSYWKTVLEKRKKTNTRFIPIKEILQELDGRASLAIPFELVDSWARVFDQEVRWPEEGGMPLFKAYLQGALIGSNAELPSEAYVPPPKGITINKDALPYLEENWDKLKLFSETPILPFLELHSLLGVVPKTFDPRVQEIVTGGPKVLLIKYAFYPYSRENVLGNYTPEDWLIAHRFGEGSNMEVFIDTISVFTQEKVTRESVRRRYELSTLANQISSAREESDISLADFSQVPSDIRHHPDLLTGSALPLRRSTRRNFGIPGPRFEPG